MKIHPITGMPLEDGAGAAPDDLQALNTQIPYIAQTKGNAAADAMRARLISYMAAEKALAEARQYETAAQAQIDAAEKTP